MKKKQYLNSSIRVRSVETEKLLNGGSITGINSGADSADDGLGYGGGGGGVAYAPEFRSVWD